MFSISDKRRNKFFYVDLRICIFSGFIFVVGDALLTVPASVTLETP